MKKEYYNPQMLLVRLSDEDVLRTSTLTSNSSGDGAVENWSNIFS